MSEKRLAGLQPGAVFEYFEELCAIPHGSHNTKAISDHIVAFAKEQGLRYGGSSSRDPAGPYGYGLREGC